MRIHSVFQTLVALIAVLVFSQPLDTLAQQEGALQTSAKIAAERDANRDINKLLWFGGGVCVPCISYSGYVIGSFLGCLSAAEHGGGPNPLYSVIGLASGPCIASIGIVNYPSSPPPGRFFGKSPAYVLAYTAAYKKKIRWLRIKWAAAGTATGCTGLMLLLTLDE